MASKNVPLTRQRDHKQRPKHERALTGAWREKDLLDSAEALHELPVQFKPNIGKEKEQIRVSPFHLADMCSQVIPFFPGDIWLLQKRHERWTQERNPPG